MMTPLVSGAVVMALTSRPMHARAQPDGQPSVISQIAAATFGR
jgi:hypothetical protein